MNKEGSTTYFTINKDVYFKTIRESFETNELLLHAVKSDIGRMECMFNGKMIDTYVDYVETIRNRCPHYLEKLLLIANQNAHFQYFDTIFKILTRHKLHFVAETGERHMYKTHITINPLVHQIVLYNTYKVVDITPTEVDVLRYCRVKTIIDLMTIDPVVIRLDYSDSL